MAITDRWQLIGARDPDTDEIKPVNIDAVSRGLAVTLFVWDSVGLEWVKMEQPMIEAGDLYVAVDQLEQYTLDQLLQYQMANYDTSSDPQYVGYLDKDGNWYIKKITDSTGVVEYVKGASGYATAWTNRASQSYDTFDAIF